ncbi:MAG: NAD(P)/FAD-dependent oxidoreductase [Marinobacter sp.]|nr:NAD(P)/FAD-dependent oxidoreductase [Marinobacter sp.]
MSSTETFVIDSLVIGAGVVGLAVARALARQGQSVVVLEQAAHFGEGISSRNSEVIHAGIYYPANSLKARLCVRGRELLYDFCRSHQVASRNCGKWLVATQPRQLSQLQAIARQAEVNGVSLQFHDAASVQRRLPGVRAMGALWSATTGIVDSHGLMLALLGDLQAMGGTLVRQAPVMAVESKSGLHRVSVGGAQPCTLQATRVVNAAGLSATGLTTRWRGYDECHRPRFWMAKGHYFSYLGRHPFDTLIYPLPEPGGLGVHLTLDLAGHARFGPDVQWVDALDYQVDPGRASAFADAIRQWWPGLDSGRLQPAYAGIRPKLHGPGQPPADFMIQDVTTHGLRGLVHLFGIESPGLTASLALADEVAERLV